MSTQYPDGFQTEMVESLSLIGLDEEVKGQPLFGPPQIEDIELFETAMRFPSKRCQLVDESKDHTGQASITVAYEVDKGVMKTFTLNPAKWDSILPEWELLGKLRIRVVVYEQQAEKYGMNRYDIWKRYLDLANAERNGFIEQEKKVLNRLKDYDDETLR
ncbi:MAG: hypothetical protein ACW976_02330 [Candidatus Ranarchaeia archaeon]|jgi:hypothetical protein